MKDCLEIFLTFLKMGCMTFGGGYAMVPILEREVINNKHWLTMDEVMDYYTIAQITPGLIAVNVATFIGRKRKGVLGGILATLGFVLPGSSLMVIISLFLANFSTMPIVRHAFTGIRVAVGALILNTVYKLSKGLFRDAKAVVILILAFALTAFTSASPVVLICAAGVAGWLLWNPGKKKKDTKK